MKQKAMTVQGPKCSRMRMPIAMFTTRCLATKGSARAPIKGVTRQWGGGSEAANEGATMLHTVRGGVVGCCLETGWHF